MEKKLKTLEKILDILMDETEWCEKCANGEMFGVASDEDHEDTLVVNPFYDISMMMKVDPKEYWGFNDEQLNEYCDYYRIF